MYREIPMTDVNYPGYHLPDVIDPPDSLCFTIRVPNDTWHIAAFLGAIRDLTVWSSWQRDSAKRGKDAARVWRDIFTSLQAQSCDLKPTTLHGTEQEEFMPLRVDCDCNVWITCCDGTEKQLLTADQVKALINGQPSGNQPQPQPGGCQQYPADLPGNNVMLVPTPVSTGDTIEISGAVGATGDSQLSWMTPRGTIYFAGLDTGIVKAAQPSDPLGSANHGQLIVNLGGSFYALTPGTPFTVPGGVTNQQPTIQSNLDLATAFGSCQFTVEVCNNAVGTWSHTFDLTLTPGPFSKYTPAGYTWLSDPVWVPGTGWQTGLLENPGPAAEFRAVLVRATVSPATDITGGSITFALTKGTDISGGAALGVGVNLYPATVAPVSILIGALSNGTQTHSGTAAGTATTTVELYLISGDAGPGTDPGGQVTVISLTLTGTGTDPF